MSAQQRDLVLIIEDEVEIRNLLVDVVFSLGFRSHQCSNGREALDLLIDKQIEPALVICDMHMPEMSGLEFVQYQLAKNLNLNVCMLTANVSQAVIIQSLQLGVSDYICKPSNFIELCDKITRLVAYGKTKHQLQVQQDESPELVKASRQSNLQRLIISNSNSTKKSA